jgi:hypothetical protein
VTVPVAVSGPELNIPKARNIQQSLQRPQERDKVIFVLLGKVKTEAGIVEVDSVHQSGC